MAFVVTTLGPSDAAVTAGAGCAYATGGEGGCSAVIVVGGELRLARRVKFLSENYAWNGGRILSGGVRFLGDRFSADVGVIAIPIEQHERIALPFVNLTWTF
jgi:hypothetical protein